MQEARGIEIPSPGGVHQGTQHVGRHHDGFFAAQHHRALLAAGQGSHLATAADLIGSLLEAVGLVKGSDFHFVGKQHIHMAIDELQEAVAVALHAEGIGEAEGHFSPVGPRHFSGGDEGLFGVIAIP